MAFELSEEKQSVTVYHFHQETGELLGHEDITVPPHTGLPAGSTVISPGDDSVGNAAIYDVTTETWSLTEDHRGKTVYSTVNGDAQEITGLGPLPDGVTTIAPANNYQKWDGSEWIDDPDTKHQAEVSSATSKLSALMAQANEKITILNDAAELGIQTAEEATQLTEWKKYRVLLSRINIITAPDIDWPEIPA